MGQLHRICCAGLLLLACSGSPAVAPRPPGDASIAAPSDGATSFAGTGNVQPNPVAQSLPGMQGPAGQTGAGGAGASFPQTIAGTGQAGVGAIAEAGDLVCAGLESDYAATLAAVQACDPFALGPTCQQSADNNLSCPGCRVAVTDSRALEALRTAWLNTRCDQAQQAQCPAATCMQLGLGICVQLGPSGMCQSAAVVPISTAP